MNTTQRRPRWPLLVSFWALACAGTRTGNPEPDPPGYDGPAPTYETSSRFAEDPEGSINQPASGLSPGVGTGIFSGARQLAQRVGDLLVVALFDQLVVYDVSDRQAPIIAGTLSLPGTPLQLDVDVDAGGTRAVLTLDERTVIDADEIPPASLRAQVTRLVYVDLSDPEAPERRGDLELEGFLHFSRRGDRYIVLDANPPLMPSCQPAQQTLLPVPPPVPRGATVTSYRIAGDAFEEIERVELPYDGIFAAHRGDSYLALDGLVSSGAQNQTLSFVDFDGDALSLHGPIAFPETPAALDRNEALLISVSGGGNVPLSPSATVALSMRVYTFDDGGDAEPAGSLMLATQVSPSGVSLTLAQSGEYALLNAQPPLLVDLRDPQNPVAAPGFTDAEHLLETPSGMLTVAAANPSEGTRAFALWDASDPSAPTMLSSLDTDWRSQRAPWWSFDADSGLFAMPFARDDEARWSLLASAATEVWLGIVKVEAGGLSIHSEQPAQLPIVYPLLADGYALSPSLLGLEVFPLLEGARDDAAVSAVVQVPEPRVGPGQPLLAGGGASLRDELEVADFSVELFAHESGDAFFVRLTPHDGDNDGAAPSELELPHRGDTLYAADGAVVVVGFDPNSVCDAGQEMPDRGCPDTTKRGISVIALSDEPHIVESFSLDSERDASPPQGVHVEDRLLGHFALHDGRVVFLVQRYERCDSVESCDRLGVPAHESFGTPGCNPQVQDCDMLPEVEVFVSGSKPSLLLYVLQDASGDPQLSRQAVLDGSFQFDSERGFEGQLLWNGDDFAIAREASLYNEEGNSVRNEHGDAIVRFYLHPVEVDAESIQAQAPINTPGRPVVFRGDQVYSLEPGYNADGAIVLTLHRSTLRQDAAYIEESLEVGGDFIDARERSGHLFVLQTPAEVCAPDVESALLPLALAPEAMTAGQRLPLPGPRWRFAYAFDAIEQAEGELVLRGGPLPSGELRVDISDPLHPEVARYRAGW